MLRTPPQSEQRERTHGETPSQVKHPAKHPVADRTTTWTTLTQTPGVRKFPKASLFSALDDLSAMALDAPYSVLCGDSEEDLDTRPPSRVDRGGRGRAC
jgi:hypothetical protein